jgi:hypothetical protein
MEPDNIKQEVVIQPHELDFLLEIAHRRNDGKTREQSRFIRIDLMSDLQADFLGLKGEWVVSKLYGAPFDKKSYGAGGDNGIDMRTPTLCACKTIHRKGGYVVIANERDYINTEIIHHVDGTCLPPHFCSCALKPPFAPQTFRYTGWMTTAKFRRVARFNADGWGIGQSCWYVPQAELESGFMHPDYYRPENEHRRRSSPLPAFARG